MFGSIGRRLIGGVGLFGFLLALVIAYKNRVGLKIFFSSLLEALALSIALTGALAFGLYLGFGGAPFKAATSTDIAIEAFFSCLILAGCMFPPVLNFVCVHVAKVGKGVDDAKNAGKEESIEELKGALNQTPKKEGFLRRKVRQVGKAFGLGGVAVGHVIKDFSDGVAEAFGKDPGKINAEPPTKFERLSLLPLSLLILCSCAIALPFRWAVAVAFMTAILFYFLSRSEAGGGKKFAAAAVFIATIFGGAYGWELGHREPDATVALQQNGTEIRGVVAFNAWSGAILIRPDKKVQTVPWSRITSIEYDRGHVPIVPAVAMLKVGSEVASAALNGVWSSDLARWTKEKFAR
jgi:hypothetical protein